MINREQLLQIYDKLAYIDNDKLVTIIADNDISVIDVFEKLTKFCYFKKAMVCVMSENNNPMYYKEMLEHSHYIVIIDKLKNKIDVDKIISKHSTETKIVVDVFDNLTDIAKKSIKYFQIK